MYLAHFMASEWYRDVGEITLSAGGSTETVYMRMGLTNNNLVSIADNRVFEIEKIMVTLVDPATTLQGTEPTGIVFVSPGVASGEGESRAGYKIVATTRAYDNLRNVSLGSENVLGVWEKAVMVTDIDGGTPDDYEYLQVESATDLTAMGSMTVASDLLFGLIVNELDTYKSDTLELHVAVYGHSKKATKAVLAGMIADLQDQ